MKHWVNPETFNNIAITLSEYRWLLLLWSFFAFALFFLLQSKVVNTTPSSLIWLVIFILFTALQSLVVASFIFFFQLLPSIKTNNTQWYTFYRTIEWCETILFTIILPLPMILFIFAFLTI